ncbi:MAG: ACP S-malonyltransferase [Chlamydiae bacterium]|nr:ACP S-malonyltransferase [Chlamydiota bacterium]
MKQYVMIFPGQGAQYVGMAKDFYEQFDLAKQVFEEAADIVSFNVADLVFNSDAEELSLTKNSQLGIYVASMAILRVIEKDFGLNTPMVAAGLSLGEYSALTAANKIKFADCLTLVRARGLYMHEASLEEQGTMAAVLGLEEEAVSSALKGLPVYVANLNCMGQVVISGKKEFFPAATEQLKQAGAKRVIPLDVSGAFHTDLMDSAKIRLEPKILQTPFYSSSVDVFMNVSAKKAETEEEIKKNLIAQVVSPVRWQASIKEIEKLSPSLYLEIGPGTTLAGMNRKNQVVSATVSIGKVEDLKLLEGALT